MNQWNLDIQETGTPLSYAYAHVHRAAYTYYSNYNSYGIQPPPPPEYMQIVYNADKLHINVNDNNNRSHYFDFNSSWDAAQVKCSYNLSTDDSRKIFGTAIHELAHVSHWSLGFSTANYLNFNSSKLAESWAQCVGWYVTKDIYSSITNYAQPWNDFDATQLASLNQGTFISNDRYTPLFIDLIDDYNQSIQGFGRPYDSAVGYSLGQLEEFLSHEPNNWTSYRNYLRDNSSNTTENDALYLFDIYDKD